MHIPEIMPKTFRLGNTVLFKTIIILDKIGSGFIGNLRILLILRREHHDNGIKAARRLNVIAMCGNKKVPRAAALSRATLVLGRP